MEAVLSGDDTELIHTVFLVSANSLMPPSNVSMHPCIYPYPQLQQHALLAQANAAAVGMPSPITHLSPRPSPYSAYHQPILYWYPSPPVSPQSAYYVHACPTTVVVKGLPFTVQIAEILALFEGIYEVQHTSLDLCGITMSAVVLADYVLSRMTCFGGHNCLPTIVSFFSTSHPQTRLFPHIYSI